MPEGEYVVTVYQDENNNGKLDSFFVNLRAFGIIYSRNGAGA
ncbi:MAG: DUF2141 domain-containing protein [Treponema sp.]|nr:DUF2141 domain-containing protein [Treponema sp.]